MENVDTLERERERERESYTLRNKEKNSKLILILVAFIVSLLFVIPTTVKAYEDTFTTTDGIVVKKVVSGTNGDIELAISNIELDSEGSYKWYIGKTSKVEETTYSSNLGDYTESTKTALISLTTSEKEILSILRATNTAFLWIKDENTENYVINGLKLDLTLPPLKAFTVTKNTTDLYSDIEYSLSRDKTIYEYWNADTEAKSTYNITNIYFKFIKITDENVISTYQNAKLNNIDLETLTCFATIEQAPNSGWTTGAKNKKWNNKILKSDVPTDAGVYYLWLKGKDSDSKTVVGYSIIDIDADGPKVKSIGVVSPNEGTYDAPQTVKINVYFDETITATQVPTLKIKFGSGSERTISEGTIYNIYNYYGDHYIEYLYNIQSTDKGQIATVSYEGGDVKDTSGNSATLSCPVITGNVIKANESGKDTNQTDNKDKNNNLTNPTPTPTATPTATPAPSSTPKPSTTPTPTSNVKNNNNNNNSNKNDDDTIAPSKLPKTGAGMLLISAVVAISISGVIAYIKVNKYRDID